MPRMVRVIAVCVIDPGSHFMEAWNTRFDALEITRLRSPAFAHPMAFEPTALLNFAIREGRTAELIDAPFVTKWLATTDVSQQDSDLKALPSTALFRDFCSKLEDTLPHTWKSGKVTSVCKDSSTGKFRVHYRATSDQRECRVSARAVILATGPVGEWNVPPPFQPHLSSRRILHTEELLVKGSGTLRVEIAKRCPAKSARVLVIGGGLTAAQAALAAFHAGHEVVLRSRRPLQTRAFDIDTKWLDMRNADRLRFEFFSLPMEKRRKACQEAASGGSVPAKYMAELHRVSQASTALRLEVDEESDRSHVSVDDGGEHVVVNGECFAMVILATGVTNAPSCSPLYRSVADRFGASIVDGLPRVDSSLRWLPDEDLFVLGANAMLELGPGGGNLMGAMRGAKIVANELHDLMWQQSGRNKATPARSFFANQYASLLGEGSEDESDEASSSDEEQVTVRAALSSTPSTATHRSPATKSKKKKKASKPSKRGMR